LVEGTEVDDRPPKTVLLADEEDDGIKSLGSRERDYLDGVLV
jgi:hypothetical protein